MIIERPYQAQLITDINHQWNCGARNVLAALPTGGGKSVVVSKIAQDNHLQGMMQCIIAHRTELVTQMSVHVAKRGIKHRIIAPRPVISQVTAEHRREFGKSFVTPDGHCAVGGVDTILARKDDLASWMKQIDCWTIDEGHHVLTRNKWGKVVDMFTNARGLGVTATPKRADGMGLGSHHDGVFDALVEGPNMRWLIDNGFLSDYEIVVPESDFEIPDDAITKSGDFSQKKMAAASKRSHIVGDVVTEYIKHCMKPDGTIKRGICFATDVETSNEIAAQFNRSNIRAESVSAKTPGNVRSEFIRRFREGSITVLVNVDLFGEGFDVPAVEIVSMARPTASLGVYLQQFGRALRLMDGKPYGLVIDHVSNWKRHNFPDKVHGWSLDRREKRAKSLPDPEEIPLTACTNCSRPYERFYPQCPYCGHMPVTEGSGRGDLEKIDGDLILLNRETIAEMMREKELEAPDSVGQRIRPIAGELAARGSINKQIERHQSQQRLNDVICQWAGIQRYMGRPDAQSYRRFYIATGMDVLTALSMKRKEMDKLSDIVEGWYLQ